MTAPPFATPSPEEARDIHARLLGGDPVAPAELAVAYLDPLTEWLAARNPGLADPHLCATAAEDALLALIKNPRSYDPQRQTLEVYLRMSAQGDLRNLLARERRHRGRSASMEVVELSSVRGKYLRDDAGDPALLIEHEAEPAQEVAVPPGLTAAEERALALMRDGERKTVAYAAALDIAHLPMEDQRREVKRVKDRLKKRIERSGGRDV